MSITEKIQQDVVSAMKAGEKTRLQALRMILSQLKMGEKEARGDFTEPQEIAVLMSEKKRRLQAAEAFREGGRVDRAEQEEAEAALIDSYLPQALSREELESIVDEAIRDAGASGPRDMGKVMSAVMPRVAGRADGGTVSDMVKGRLTGK